MPTPASLPLGGPTAAPPLPNRKGGCATQATPARLARHLWERGMGQCSEGCTLRSIPADQRHAVHWEPKRILSHTPQQQLSSSHPLPCPAATRGDAPQGAGTSAHV